MWVQNLRSIYGEIAVHFFCPSDIGIHRFIQQRLGHLISDPELAHSKNSGSTEHYFHYYLIDHQGQPLTTKGILRAKTNLVDSTPDQEVKQLELTTEVETEPETTAEPPSHPSLPTPTVHHSSEVITPKKLPTPNSELEHSDVTISPSPVEAQLHLEQGEFLSRIATLINSEDYQSLLVGLMAATGLDAASLLKLLVFKQAAAPHLILYCPQLHPAHQPLQQLITLLPAADVLAALERLRRHREAIDFAHRRTGEEINTEVTEIAPTVLARIGLSQDLNLRQQYIELIPLLLKENIPDDEEKEQQPTLDLSAETQHQFELWQQHFDSDVEQTLNELMRLASSALQSLPAPQPQPNSSSPISTTASTSEPSPWLAISRLTETVANLTSQVMTQNERLINLQLGHSAPPLARTSPQSQTVIKTSTPPTAPPPALTTTTTNTTTPTTTSRSPDFETLANLSSAELRLSRVRGAPREKLKRALNAIIQYNQQQEDPKQMWRINTNVLQTLTGCFNSPVKQFVRDHQSALDEHNQQFHLTSVRHNASHHGLDPNLFIQW